MYVCIVVCMYVGIIIGKCMYDDGWMLDVCVHV